MNTPTLSLRRRKLSDLKAKNAFSLIELLVVIAIIGIIAAIAIPNIGNLTGSADKAKNQRNAQTIASVSSSAIAAGYVPTGTTGTDEVALLIAGVHGEGSMVGATFKLDMDPDDYNTEVKTFLNYGPAPIGFSYVKDGTGGAN